MRSLHQEVTDLLGDNVADAAEYEVVVAVNSGSNFLDEAALLALCRVGFVEPRLLGLVVRMAGVERGLFRSVSLVFLESHVVGENVVLLSLDN